MSRNAWIAVIVVVAALLGASYFLMRGSDQEPEPEPTPPASTEAPEATDEPSPEPEPTEEERPPLDVQPPVSQLVWPTDGLSLPEGQVLQVITQAADDQGLARVDLLVDGALVQSSAIEGAPTSSTVVQEWTPWTPGERRISTVAYDVAGNASAPDGAAVVVESDEADPSVSILSPAGGTQVPAGTLVPVAIAAYDGGGIRRVELWVDGAIYSYVDNAGEDPRTQSATIQWRAAPPGEHTLVARAVDLAGRALDSAPLSLGVRNESETALSISPSSDTVLEGETLDIYANASNPAGVTRMELYRDDARVDEWRSGSASGESPVYRTFTWRDTEEGRYRFRVRAYDNYGGSADSNTVDVRVVAQPEPTSTRPPRPTAVPTARPTAAPRPPQVAITAPASGFALTIPPRESVQVSVAASSEAGLRMLRIWAYLPGGSGDGPTTREAPQPTLLAEQPVSGTEVEVDVSIEAPAGWVPTTGTVSLFARVEDVTGQTATSDVITGRVEIEAAAVPLPSDG